METANAPKKIAYIITLASLGGAQSHLYEVMKNIRLYGYEPLLICGNKGWLTAKAEQLGISVHIAGHMLREISPCNDWKALGEIKNILRAEKPVLVHCHSSKAGILGRMAAKSCGVPAVFTAHGWAFTEGVASYKRYIYALLERMMLRLTAKVICVSDYDKCLADRWLGNRNKTGKILTIHNGIADIETRSRTKAAEECFRVGMVGRFAVPKKQLDLLRAIKLLLNKGHRNLHLVLVGDGELLVECRRYAEMNKMHEYVTFMGARHDIADILQRLDVFCLISDYEGLPISIIEAMRAGLPVVASDVGGVKELVKDGVNGYLVAKGNVSMLAEKLVALKRDRQLCHAMGTKSREKYENEFGINKMIDSIVRVYKEIA